MLQMVRDIKGAMRQDTRARDERETKKRRCEDRRGRTHRYTETGATSSIRVTRDESLATAARAEFNRRRTLRRSARPSSRRVGMTPPTVNAIQPRSQQHQLSRRHPAAAVLPGGAGRRGQLRRRGRRHRARAHPWLRRSGPQVRRTGQPARLVDRVGRRRLRAARDLRGRSVQWLHRRRRHEDQRPPHAR